MSDLYDHIPTMNINNDLWIIEDTDKFIMKRKKKMLRFFESEYWLIIKEVKDWVINNKKRIGRIYMLCKICGVNETENPDGICDDCKVSIITDDDIPPTF